MFGRHNVLEATLMLQNTATLVYGVENFHDHVGVGAEIVVPEYFRQAHVAVEHDVMDTMLVAKAAAAPAVVDGAILRPGLLARLT